MRLATATRLRELYPGGRIIHELPVGRTSRRIDVAIVTDKEVHAVEIKSCKDRLDRLPAQVAAFESHCDTVTLVLDERFFDAERCGTVRRNHHWNGPAADRVWRWPEPANSDDAEDRYRWTKPTADRQLSPRDRLAFLRQKDDWHVMDAFGLGRAFNNYSLDDLIDHLAASESAEDISRFVCHVLKARFYTTADPHVIYPWWMIGEDGERCRWR